MAMWWARFRRMRHTLFLGILGSSTTVLLAMTLQGHARRGGSLGLVGRTALLVFAVLVALGIVSYVIEEAANNVLRKRHLCVNCGHRIPVRSFGIKAKCPHCHDTL
jgi:hypothetical protein